MRSNVFLRGLWSIGVAAGLALASMGAYRGGTPHDRAVAGYSFFHNFLSDLGMTVAYDGRSNRLGATLFVISLTTLAIGLGVAVIAFMRTYSSPLSRRLARAAAIAGIIVIAAFLGVALTPENRVMALHIRFTFFAFRVFPVAPLLLMLASRYEAAMPARITIAWAALTTVLVAYLGVLELGPTLDSARGLVVQVTAQKSIAVLAIGILGYVCYQANALVTRARVR